MSYIKPPILRGTAEQQLAALRDYLFRLTSDLDAAESADEEQGAAVVTNRDGTKTLKAGGGSTAEIDERLKSSANELRALIIKSANEVEAYADSKTESYDERYLARSDFGTFQSTLQTQIETTARGVVESYDYQSSISAAADSIERLDSLISGEIRRGMITDPATHETALGIAISERLSFTGASQTVDGLTYYELSPGQTLGLYTATGWQFWINGVRVGYFASSDSQLHVAKAAIESEMSVGEWLISSVGGFGIRKA